jgi:XTP/dITP diphosphohydrolase
VRATLASHNANKLRELAHALEGWELALLDADDYPPEDGETYYENARAKALYGRRLAGNEWVLGEDSGIEVIGLGGAPGIYSARFGGREPVDRLLAELARVEGHGRRARYVCELVAVAPDGREARGTGSLEGRIGTEARGTEGFGYDPIFVPDGEQRTVAELGNGWKRQNSHRARAARHLARELREAGDLL